VEYSINIKIIHPTNNSDIEIGCPENILLRDIFSQLIEANFLSSGQSYSGVLKPRDVHTESVPLDNDKTLGENGVENNDVILTLIATQAGGWVDRNLNRVDVVNSDSPLCILLHESPRVKVLGTSGLGISDIPKVSFEEMLKEKQSIIMALNAYQNLEEENRHIAIELNRMKLESNDRKSAVIVNTIAGIVMSIGTAFLTNAVVPAITTIGASVLITTVGIWLAFKKQK